MAPQITDLTGAVAEHVHPSDTVAVVMGHHRWSALVRELARQRWGQPMDLTLVMGSLGTMGTLLFRAGLLSKVVTAYSGDAFPTYSPNPVFTRAYASGSVAVEHWSFLTLRRRLEAAALGLPLVTTTAFGRAAMRTNPAYSEHAGVGLLEPLVPDVTLMHAAAATPEGDLALAHPLLDGPAAAWAARRGVLATVEKIVDRLPAAAVRVPAHRVLAVVEAPFGAHPGGLYAGPLPVRGYAEDVAFWSEARRITRNEDAFEQWCRDWCLDLPTHQAYLDRLGPERLEDLVDRLDPAWVDPGLPPLTTDPPGAWETAAALGAREVRATAEAYDAVLAGAGIANLAAWVGVAQARGDGHPTRLVAELGLMGYTPTQGSPFIFEFRSFPGAAMLGDSADILGTVVTGPGTRTLGCLGCAQVDALGDLNSTVLGGKVLVGSGGGADVALGADAVTVITLLRPGRTPERVEHVTSPGDRVQTIVTDKGVLRRLDGALRLTESVGDPADAVAACGWPLEVSRDVVTLEPPALDEVVALRRFDPHGHFLKD